MHTSISILLYSHLVIVSLANKLQDSQISFCATLPQTHFSLFFYKARVSPLSSSATLQQNKSSMYL